MSEAAAVSLAHPGPADPAALNRSKLGMWLFLGSEVMFFTGFFAAYIVLRSSNVIKEDQHLLNWKLAALNTVVLIASSFTMAMAVGSIQRGNVGRLRLFLALTLLCAFGFMVIKYIEYSAKLGLTKTVNQAGLKEMCEKYENLGRQIALAAPLTFENDEGEKQTLSAGTKIKWKGLGEQIAESTPEIPEIRLRTPIDPSYSVFFGCYYTLTGFHGLHVLGGIVVLLGLLLRAHKFSAQAYTGVEITGLYWHFVDVVWIFLFPALYLL